MILLKKVIITFLLAGCVECVGAGKERVGYGTLEHPVEPSWCHGSLRGCPPDDPVDLPLRHKFILVRSRGIIQETFSY